MNIEKVYYIIEYFIKLTRVKRYVGTLVCNGPLLQYKKASSMTLSLKNYSHRSGGNQGRKMSINRM